MDKIRLSADVLTNSDLYTLVHNGMMSMMMRSLISEPLGGVVSGAIFGACPECKGTALA